MLNDRFAPYIQSQLPDVNIEFIVGNNDLDFYKFMNENGELPDIITCHRFSLHDAADLKDQLLDLSTTEEAGAIYESYIDNFTNSDGTVNWLPICGTVDGLVANRALFEEYDIPLPTDYDSMVSACQSFEEKGIRGFVADFVYDYTCMEVFQGLSIPEITSMEGRMWRSDYENPSEDSVGLDQDVWLGAFESMEQFIKDVNILPTDLEKDTKRQKKAMQVLEVMLSEEGQNHFANGEDVVSKMIEGEYDAKQAYEAFDAQLKQPKEDTAKTVLSINRSYSRIFHKKGGNESYSAMANTLRGFYGSDVLIAPAYNFTGSLFKADYTEKMVGNMIMPNSLEAYQCEMDGTKLKEYLKSGVEGVEEGFRPFNRGSLPTVSHRLWCLLHLLFPEFTKDLNMRSSQSVLYS